MNIVTELYALCTNNAKGGFNMGIGPSTKETTLFRFRDPLLDVVSNDEEVNLLGIIVSGTPQSNDEKVFCASRAALLAKALGAKGAIVSTDGWGNSNIDPQQ